MLFTDVHPYPQLHYWLPKQNYTSDELISLQGKDLKFTCCYKATTDSNIFQATWRINKLLIQNSSHYEIIRIDEQISYKGNNSVISILVIHNFKLSKLLYQTTEINCEGGYNLKLIYNTINPTLAGSQLFIIYNNISAKIQGEY